MQFLSVLLFASGISALGINCRGSAVCQTNGGASLSEIRDELNHMISQGHGSRVYGPGKQIACSKGFSGHMCAFYQSGASGTPRDAVQQIERLMRHGCRGCGSVPTNPGNDVSRGQLTANYVSRACCSNDNCWCL